MMIYDDEAGNAIVNTGYCTSTAKSRYYAMRFKTREEAEKANKDTSIDFLIIRRFLFFGDYILVTKKGWYLSDYENNVEIYNEGTGLGCQHGNPYAAINAHCRNRVFGRS